jgi:hypothetical protein
VRVGEIGALLSCIECSAASAFNETLLRTSDFGVGGGDDWFVFVGGWNLFYVLGI